MKTATRAAAIVCLSGLLAGMAFAAEEPKYGAIEVSSDPDAARVYIEGFLAGESPVKVDQVLPGPYRIVVKKEGHEDFGQDVQVTAGEISKVAAGLTPGTGSWRSPVRAEDDWTPVLDKDKKKYEKAKGTKRFRDYRVLEIANFLVKSDEVVPPDHLYTVFRDLSVELEKRTKFDRFATNYTRGRSPRWTESGGEDSQPTLVLSGVITRYQRGSRVKRWAIGFGAGKTRIYCLFRLVDKETGEVLLERMENGSISGGFSFLGGASAGATKELAEDIANVIKKNW